MKQRLLFLALYLVSLAGWAQTLPYPLPPRAIATLAEVPATPRVSVSPNGTWLLMLDVQEQPTPADLAQPELRLAGLRINPRTNGLSRVSYATSLRLKRLPNGKELLVQGLPANARISEVTWSPDNTKLAFTHTTNNRIELWLADVEAASARLVPNLFLNGVFGSSYEWVSDSKTLLVRAIVGGRGQVPVVAASPAGAGKQPDGRPAAATSPRAGLLANLNDELAFNYYALAQVVKVSVDGRMQPLGSPGIIQQATPSPDGRFVLVKTRHRPFSYKVPVSGFPLGVEVLNMEGLVVKELAELPLADSVAANPEVVTAGARGHGWREDAPATVYWVEAQDGGNPKTATAIRDRMFGLPAPFDAKPLELATLPMRFATIYWGTDKLALVQGFREADHRQTMWTLDLATKTSLSLLYERSSLDSYTEPGTPHQRRNELGRLVLATDGRAELVYLLGNGASAEGDRPFVDELNVRNKKITRWWRSEAPYYEVPLAILNPAKHQLLTRRESATEAPNYFLRDVRSNRLTALTQFSNPYASLGGLKKQVLKYKRADGVDLTATLYLPATYKKEDGPLPTLLETDPVEFKYPKIASQVTGSPYAFARLSWASPVFWVTQGYAVLQGASLPMRSESSQQTDNSYTELLVASARAAIDEGKRLGVVDPARVAVLGHSYGAYMTASLLAHSSLFRAGIARSGAYDRPLTPFDLQGERPLAGPGPAETYPAAPFAEADKIAVPLLLIHASDDQYTDPLAVRGEQFYDALKGQEPMVRAVSLPAGLRGYATRESTMRTLAEMNAWLDTHLQNPPTAAAAAPAPDAEPAETK